MRLKNIEGELKSAIEGDNTDALDDVIERYEALQMNLNPQLLQEAIVRRNFLVKLKAAERTIKAAKTSWDTEVMEQAVAVSCFSGFFFYLLCLFARRVVAILVYTFVLCDVQQAKEAKLDSPAVAELEKKCEDVKSYRADQKKASETR